MAGLKIITPPAIEPVALSDIKAQLQIDSSDTIYDTQLTALIPAARSWCEQYQNRSYITQTLELALDCWPHCGVIDLPRPPLQSVTSVKYGDAQDAWDSTNYIADTFAFVGRIVRVSSWPSGALPAANGVRVTYVAGYGSTADKVPVVIKQAIIILVVHWFNNGVCDPPPAVYSLLNLDRVVPI